MPRKPKSPTSTKASVVPRLSIARAAKGDAALRIQGKIGPIGSTIEEEKKKAKAVVPKNAKLLKQAPYASMVAKAIKQNKNKKGTSSVAILRFIEANYELKTNWKGCIKNAMRRAVEKGVIVRKGVRYDLPTSVPKTKKKKATTKKGTKKTTKKTTEKTTEKTPKKAATKKSKSTPREKAVATKASPRKVGKPASKGKVKETPTTTSKTGGRGKAAATKTTDRGKKSSSTESGDSGKLIWVWQYYHDGFFNYDPAASDTVEGVYQEYLTSPYTCDVRAVKSGEWDYEVDFRGMTQRNIRHAAHTIRNIRRIQIPESEKSNGSKRYEGTPEETASVARK